MIYFLSFRLGWIRYMSPSRTFHPTQCRMIMQSCKDKIATAYLAADRAGYEASTLYTRDAVLSQPRVSREAVNRLADDARIFSIWSSIRTRHN